jgi:transcriptional regulator with XRE-family HTH domain
MEDYKRIIANNITELRKAVPLTQAELAEKLNYSDKAVSKWERGESIPDVIVLKQIAELFGVTVDYLLEDVHPLKSTVVNLVQLLNA